MPKLYAELRENVEKELCDLKYFATTTDLRSSPTMEPFLSLTIHYITDDWNLGSRCLQTSYFPAEHTAEEIAQGLKEALESWGFKEESQVCITTDNGTNVVKAASLNDWTRLQCFGHRLDLVIGRLKHFVHMHNINILIHIYIYKPTWYYINIILIILLYIYIYIYIYIIVYNYNILTLYCNICLYYCTVMLHLRLEM